MTSPNMDPTGWTYQTEDLTAWFEIARLARDEHDVHVGLISGLRIIFVCRIRGKRAISINLSTQRSVKFDYSNVLDEAGRWIMALLLEARSAPRTAGLFGKRGLS